MEERNPHHVEPKVIIINANASTRQADASSDEETCTPNQRRPQLQRQRQELNLNNSHSEQREISEVITDIVSQMDQAAQIVTDTFNNLTAQVTRDNNYL